MTVEVIDADTGSGRGRGTIASRVCLAMFARPPILQYTTMGYAKSSGRSATASAVLVQG